MKRSVLLAVCLWPALAYGQQTYTNADLGKFSVPGAYTNEDLRQLPPLAVQRTPAAPTPFFSIEPVSSAPFQAAFDNMKRTRAALVEERDFEVARVEFSESAFAGDSMNYGYGRPFAPRLGYATKVASFIGELDRRIALLDRQMDDLRDAARRAGAAVDVR
jgi:hypothetical protein